MQDMAYSNPRIPITFFVFSNNILVSEMRGTFYAHLPQGDEVSEVYLDSFCAGITELSQGRYTVIGSSPCYIFQSHGMGDIEVYDGEGWKLKDIHLKVADIPIKDGQVRLEKIQDQ